METFGGSILRNIDCAKIAFNVITYQMFAPHTDLTWLYTVHITIVVFKLVSQQHSLLQNKITHIQTCNFVIVSPCLKKKKKKRPTRVFYGTTCIENRGNQMKCFMLAFRKQHSVARAYEYQLQSSAIWFANINMQATVNMKMHI